MKLIVKFGIRNLFKLASIFFDYDPFSHITEELKSNWLETKNKHPSWDTNDV